MKTNVKTTIAALALAACGLACQAGADAINRTIPAPAVDTGVLLNAWNRWMLKLPGPYQRSIYNFDQFVVMGAAVIQCDVGERCADGRTARIAADIRNDHVGAKFVNRGEQSAAVVDRTDQIELIL